MELTGKHYLIGTLKQFGVAALYALSLYVGELYFENEEITGYFEPASGLALAVLLIGGKRYALGVFLGAIMINAISTNSFWVGGIISSGDTLQALCGAWLLAGEGRFDLHLQSLRAYLRLILLGGCASIATGALMVSSLLLFAGLLTSENYFHSLIHWWMSDTLGVILIAPLFIAWWRAKCNWRETGQMAEAVMLLGLTIFVGQIVFLDWLRDSVGLVAKGYWMFLFTTWVAVRLGTRGTVIVLVVVAVQALLGAIHGVGFFADDIAKTSLVNYWFYMLTLSVVSMALATYFTERKQIEAALRNHSGELALHNHIFKQVNQGVPLCEILEDLARQVENRNPGMSCAILLPDVDGKLLRYGAAPGLSDYCDQPIKGGDGQILGTFAVYSRKPAQPADTEIALVEHYADLAAQVIGRVRNRDDLCLKNLALNSAANAIVITDKNSRIEWVNHAFGKLTGYSATEAVGRYPKELVKSGEHSQDFYRKLWQTIISGEVWHGEIVNRRKDGSLYHEEMTITPVPDEQGEITHFVAVKQDITERVKAGLALKRNKLIVDTVNDGFMIVDALGNVLEVNAIYAEISGYTVDELVNMHIAQFEAIEQSVVEVRAHIEKIIAQGCSRFETRHRHKDGHEIDVEISVTFMPESQQFFAFIRDITERKQAERQLRESKARFRAIIEASPVPFALNDEQQNITYLNSSFIRTFGYTLEDIPTLTEWWPKAYPDPAYRQWVAATWQMHLEEARRKNEPFEPLELIIRRKDGGIRTVLVGAALLGASFEGVHLVSFYDITERKWAEAELRESEKLLRAITDNTSAVIFMKDVLGRYLHVNRQYEKLFHVSNADIYGKTDHDIFPPGVADAFIRNDQAVAHSGKSLEIEEQVPHDDGIHTYISVKFPLRHVSGEIYAVCGIATDITERKRAEEQIYNLAFHDSLTKLPNRRLLNDRLEQIMAASKRSRHYGALLFLDLDNFKPLNDAYGHGVGDLLLIEAARRIAGCVRETDTVARFGGDEFVVALGELDASKTESALQACIVAEKIRSALAEPYLLIFKHDGEIDATVEHRCAASIGAVLFFSHEASADDIIKWADMAMYRAKEGGRNSIRFYE